MDTPGKEVKSHRYEKIRDSIINKVRSRAEDLFTKNGLTRISDDHGKIRKYKITELEADRESILAACDEILENIEDMFGSVDIYWITEIILNEEFGCSLSIKNPYKIEKKKGKLTVEISETGAPIVKVEEE